MQQNPFAKNLIFDLGGVILDLSVDHTLEAFSTLSGMDITLVKKIFFEEEAFFAYEKGELSDAGFRSFVRERYKLNATDQQIDDCWNAMLRGIPVSKLTLLQRLKARHNVYLLSNTNGIHLGYINDHLLPSVTGETSLDPYFHKAYYSHQMRKRKPEAEIYRQVLEENNLAPHETLFLDDNVANIAGAEAVGIQAVWVNTPDFMLNYFHAERN